MTNSEKAFEEWGEKIWLDGDRTALDFASSFNEEEAKKLCRFIWASAIEFAAKVCREGIHWCPDFKNEIHDITKQTCQRLEEEIRKQGLS